MVAPTANAVTSRRQRVRVTAGSVARSIVLASTLLAIGTTSYLASRSLPLFTLTVAAFLAAVVLTGIAGRPGVLLPLSLAYVTPALFVALAGHNHHAYVVLWISALAGVISRTSWAADWSLPPKWRWPIICWALIVATSWPLVAARELDFTLQNLWNERLPVAGLRISGQAAVAWTAYAALTQLIGLLWVDWLYRMYPAHGRSAFTREIVWPLAAGITAGCIVAAYQGFADIHFLNGHVWPSVNRASGTLMDANAFGMLAALWGPVFLATGLASMRPLPVYVAFAALLATWVGVWTSGSRTALLAAVFGMLLAIPELPKLVPSRRARLRLAAGVLAAALAFAVIVRFGPLVTATALQRGRDLLPSLSAESIRKSTETLWARGGYGTAAVAMIREFPLTGVGVGAFHTLAYNYAMETAGVSIPPDNAQNWFRHQAAELGILGSVGWTTWVIVFATALWRHNPRSGASGTIIRAPLIAFAAASLLGVPAQDPAVAITFWVLVFWYAADEVPHSAAASKATSVAAALALVVVAGYLVLQATHRELRPPFRASRFGFPYTYGFHFDRADMIWSAKHGVTVQAAPERWMKLTVWVSHPDADEQPVEAQVWVDGKRVLNRRLGRNRPVVEYVQTLGAGERFVLEAQVDRTFRPADADAQSHDLRELGLGMKWEFAAKGPA